MNLKEYIQYVHNGNKLHAAKALNITRRTIYQYLKEKSFPVRKRVVENLRNAGIEVPTV